MQNYIQNTYVVGTAALKPRCQKESNPTGIVVQFPNKRQEPEFYSIDYSKLVRAHHASLRERAKALVLSLLQKSGSLYSLRTGDLKGKPFGAIPRYKYILAGALYSCIALIALFITV